MQQIIIRQKCPDPLLTAVRKRFAIRRINMQTE